MRYGFGGSSIVGAREIGSIACRFEQMPNLEGWKQSIERCGTMDQGLAIKSVVSI
jgi:antibiotic biosynthesis monooxygenase (ABM) superfamily enzyme